MLIDASIPEVCMETNSMWKEWKKRIRAAVPGTAKDRHNYSMVCGLDRNSVESYANKLSDGYLLSLQDKERELSQAVEELEKRVDGLSSRDFSQEAYEMADTLYIIRGELNRIRFALSRIRAAR